MSLNEEQTDSFRDDLAELIPHLRAFARHLCADGTQADHLAQDAMLKAWRARDSYTPGTNMKAWTFTILRNVFYSEKRRSWRRQPLDQEVAEATLVANDDQAASMELLSLTAALDRLPEDQREALVLVGAGGLAYEDVAEICDCAVGTVKSRVSRARMALAEIMKDDDLSIAGDDDSVSAHDAFDDLLQEADDLADREPTA